MYCRKKCNELMDGLGFKESYRGTDYFRTGVAMVCAKRNISMTKELYPALARAADTSPAAVERSMRFALEAATESPMWDHNWRSLGGWDHPTNNEVLRRLAREMDE